MKLTNRENHLKVPITSLRLAKNVRKEFDQKGIEQLAQSIRRDGLMNPITVRPPIEDENGVKTYEIIAGERRFWAHKWLCDEGDDFSMIECCIRTGDTWTLQMIENIQRADLSQREKEEAISAAMESGMTMTEIAEKLCKPISYVSDIVAGIKVRRAADEAALDTDEISTKALSQLRSIPKERQPEAVKELKKRGGSVRAATEILNETKPKSPKSSDKSPAEKSETKVSDDETFVAAKKSQTESADFVEEPKVAPLPSPAVKEAAEKNDGAGGEFFVRVRKWKAKNKLMELVLEVVSPFDSTLMAEESVSIFFRKIQDSIAALCDKFPHTMPLTTELSDIGESPLISCHPSNDPLFFTLFSISFTKIRGRAEDLFDNL